MTTKAELEAKLAAVEAQLAELKKQPTVKKTIRITEEQASALDVAGITVPDKPRAGYLSEFMRDVLDMPEVRALMTGYAKEHEAGRRYAGQFAKYSKQDNNEDAE